MKGAERAANAPVTPEVDDLADALREIAVLPLSPSDKAAAIKALLGKGARR